MKATPFLTLYEKFVTDGSLPRIGLCASIGDLVNSEAWKMVSPNQEEQDMLEGNGNPFGYWGVESYKYPDGAPDDYLRYGITPRRENLLLFAAALNGEFDN